MLRAFNRCASFVLAGSSSSLRFGSSLGCHGRLREQRRLKSRPERTRSSGQPNKISSA
jgi:hypothetical protein